MAVQDMCSKRVGGSTIFAYLPASCRKPCRITSNAIVGKTNTSVPQGYNSEKAITMPMITDGQIKVEFRGEGSTSSSISAIGYVAVNMQGVGSIGLDAHMGAERTLLLQGSGSLSAGIEADGLVSIFMDAGARPSAFDIAQEVWNGQKTAYNTAGTMGNAVNSAGSSGDPWGTPLPGSYPPGSAGALLGAMDAVALAEAILTDPRFLTVAKYLGLK